MQLRFDPLRPEAARPKIAAAIGHARGRIFAICGQDPLLQTEAADLTRAALRDAGFDERTLDVPDRGFNWQEWLSNANTPSLFSARRLTECRLATGKPGVEGGKVLTAWSQSPPPDNTLLILLPRLDRQLASAAWFKEIDAAGTVVTVSDIQTADLPTWLRTRLSRHGLEVTPEALRWLASRCEGNLSAAEQEILKLTHLPPSRAGRIAIDLEDMQAAVTDHARFNPFQVGDTLVAGDAARSLRVLRGLREEGEALPLLIWSVAQSCRRLPIDLAAVALRSLGRIDTMVKGLCAEDPWVALEQLAMQLAQQTVTNNRQTMTDKR